MKKVILTLTALILAVCMNATEHTETFSGLNSTTAKDGKHTFDLGEWTFSGMAYGSSALKFNTNGAYIISPKLDNITKLSFTYRSGGSNKKITVSYSVDGTNWTEIDNFTIPSSSSSFSTWTKNIGLSDKTGIQFRILAASSNCYIKVFTASDEDTGSGGNHDYSDDPDYKTEGVWIPTKAFPAAKRPYISAPPATMRPATVRKKSPGTTLQRHTRTPNQARTSSAAAANITSTNTEPTAN